MRYQSVPKADAIRTSMLSFASAVLELSRISAEKWGTRMTKPLPRRSLTPRQQQIVTLLLYGFSNKIMADRLNASESTVKQHLIDLRNIFGAENRTRLAVILTEIQVANLPPPGVGLVERP